MSYPAVRYTSEINVLLSPLQVCCSLDNCCINGTIIFTSRGDGSYICKAENDWFVAETILFVKRCEPDTQLIMETGLAPVQIIMSIFLPFVKWYMHKKQYQDLKYIADIIQ